MRILIVEDEELAVRKLQNTLLNVDTSTNVVGVTDSIQSTIEWLRDNNAPDLILMDIELSDGQSFEVFSQIEVKSPVIFTTSYDEYALKAFKVNSVDYLLKPIQKDELEAALNKYRMLHVNNGNGNINPNINIDNLLMELQTKLQGKEYRKRFLVKHGQRLVSVDIDEIVYFFSDGRLNFFKTNDNRKFVVDYTMDELEEMLNPGKFFRISRSFYVCVNCIEKIDEYFGNRLILSLRPASEKEVLVSRERVTDFKKWMGK